MANEIDKALNNLQSIKQGSDPRSSASTSTHQPTTNVNPFTDQQSIRKAFVEVVNIVEPSHPYCDNPWPATFKDFEWSYCQASSTYAARCGPRGDKWSPHKVAKFYSDKSYFAEKPTEKGLTTLVHEATHITEGRHTAGSNHNPKFWQTMARNARILIDNLDQLSFGHTIDVSEFEEYVVNNPNRSMTDRRSRTVKEQKEEIRKIIGAWSVEV